MDVFTVIYLSVILLAFLTGWSIYRHTSKSMQMIICYLGVVFLCELVSFILRKTVRHNLVIHNISPGIYLYCMCMFFYHSIQDTLLKKYIIPSFVLMIIFAIINTNFIQGWNTYPTYIFNAYEMLLLFWSAMLFLEMLEKQPVQTNIFKNPVFISAISILWFAMASFLFFLLYNVFSKHKINYGLLLSSHNFANIVFYLMLFTAVIFEKLSIQSCQKNLSVS